jgi:hypothetical protein
MRRTAEPPARFGAPGSYLPIVTHYIAYLFTKIDNIVDNIIWHSVAYNNFYHMNICGSPLGEPVHPTSYEEGRQLRRKDLLVPKGFNTQEPAHRFAGKLWGEVVDYLTII